MADMRRRDFLITALSSAGLLGASGLLDRNSAYADILRDVRSQVFTRRNVYCMRAHTREIVSYKAAITAMMALPNTNGTGWDAQANIHGASAPPAGMIANACQHGTTFFLSWHRMYVYFFERIVRNKSGDPDFALPYWGYSPTGMRDLPALFRTPANATNPLYTSNRNATINAGALITASLVDSGTALAQTTFNSFTNSLNGTPHGAVHVAVGGGMSSFQGAGHDPIFWLHHCNIDRLWELWLASGGGRVNPSDAAWLTTSFSFYDETGATASLTGAQIVDTACQLHYQYESDICGRLHANEHGWWRRYSQMVAAPSAMLARLDSLETRPLRPQAQPIAQSQDTVRLGSSVVRITLPISEEGKRILSALPRDADVGGRINLVLEDIHVEGTPRVAYEIFIDLPQEEPIPMYTSSHYAGNVNLFGPAPGAEHPQKAEPQVVPLSLVFLRLTEAKLWSLDSVSVTFVPRGLTEGQNPARVLRQSIQVTIGRVTLQVQ